MMLYKIILPTVAVSANEIIETGKTVGTASNQVILGMLVVALILVAIYREIQQVKANRKAEERHVVLLAKSETQFNALVVQQSKDRDAWDEERKARITMLMGLVNDNTRALDKTANAVLQNNTLIIELKEIINDFRSVITKLDQHL